MLNRRDFGKIVLGATALSFAACNGLSNSLATVPANKQRVVIVGGGFGGAVMALIPTSQLEAAADAVATAYAVRGYAAPRFLPMVAGFAASHDWAAGAAPTDIPVNNPIRQVTRILLAPTAAASVFPLDFINAF